MISEQLSIKDVYGILKTCKKLGISRISYRGFEAEFDGNLIETGPKMTRNASEVVLQQLDAKTKAKLDMDRKQDELALLAIEDPLAYEKHLLSDDSAYEPEEDDSNLE